MSEMGAGSGLRQRPKKKLTPKIDRLPRVQSKEDTQAWAIRLAKVIEAPCGEWEAQIQEELGIRADDTIEQLLGDDTFLGLEPPMPVDGFWDFPGYEEDNPLHDADDPLHFPKDWQKNEMEASEADGEMDPLPDIVMDEFGNITIPKENLLSEYLAGVSEETLSRSTLLRQQIRAIQLLRSLAEEIHKNLKDFLLSGERDFSKIVFKPLTQKGIMDPIEIKDKHLRSRLANCYVKTPYWGTLHLSAFLQKEVQKVSDEWEGVLGDVRRRISKEDPEHPVKNKVLWEAVKNLRSEALKDSKEFRNKMREAGVPLQKPRKDIFVSTKKWVKDHNVTEVERSHLPRIREILQNKYGMFSSGQTIQCNEEQFIPFVEERIVRVLKELGVRIISKGGDLGQ